MGKVQEKAFFENGRLFFDCGTESGSIVVKYGLIIWVFPLKGREAGYASYCMFLWLIRDISQ